MNLSLLVQGASLMSAKEKRSFCVGAGLNWSSSAVRFKQLKLL